MRMSKMGRGMTTAALVAIAAFSLYSAFKNKSSYKELRSGYHDLKNKFADMTTRVNLLSRQVRSMSGGSDTESFFVDEYDDDIIIYTDEELSVSDPVEDELEFDI